jgi:hypothetical protein
MGDVGIVVDPAIDPTSPPTSQEINVLVTGFGVRIQTSLTTSLNLFVFVACLPSNPHSTTFTNLYKRTAIQKLRRQCILPDSTITSIFIHPTTQRTGNNQRDRNPFSARSAHTRPPRADQSLLRHHPRTIARHPGRIFSRTQWHPARSDRAYGHCVYAPVLFCRDAGASR